MYPAQIAHSFLDFIWPFCGFLSVSLYQQTPTSNCVLYCLYIDLKIITFLKWSHYFFYSQFWHICVSLPKTWKYNGSKPLPLLPWTYSSNHDWILLLLESENNCLFAKGKSKNPILPTNFLFPPCDTCRSGLHVYIQV